MNEFKTYTITGKPLPLVIEPEDKRMSCEELTALLQSQNDWFKSHLLKHGGLLFRNFPLKTADDFGKIIHAMGTGKFINYIGGDSPRKIVKEGIYTSTEAPPSVNIPLHNELSFVNKYPSHIYFFCEIAPTHNGETILGDSREVLRNIDPSVRKKFEEKRLKYVSAYYRKSKLMDLMNPSHKSWHQVFETDSKQEVERLCAENQFSLKWYPSDWIQISQMRPATMRHPVTQEDVWFNQAHLFDFNPRLLGIWRYVAAQLFYFPKHTRLHEVYYGDGSKIRREELYHVMDVLEKNTLKFPWKEGDLLVLDNVLSMHGRATFRCKRRVLAAMTGT